MDIENQNSNLKYTTHKLISSLTKKNLANFYSLKIFKAKMKEHKFV